MTGFWSKVRLAVVAILLAVTTDNGLREGMNATHFADTPGMRIATAAQLLYGITALAALVAILFRRQLVFGLLVAWSCAVIVTATMAPLVYGQAPLSTRALSGAGAALIAALVLLMWHQYATSAAKRSA